MQISFVIAGGAVVPTSFFSYNQIVIRFYVSCLLAIKSQLQLGRERRKKKKKKKRDLDYYLSFFQFFFKILIFKKKLKNIKNILTIRSNSI